MAEEAIVAVTTSEAITVISPEIEKVSVTEVAPREETREEEVEHKVFVGNLAFSTTEQTLAEFFNETGKVIKANIITRGTRSLGYGFVALETDEDAKKVVEILNKQELDGRQINVEVAKPKNENISGDNNVEINDSTAVTDAPATNGTNENDHTPPKRRGGYLKTGEPSKTVVFVANLPFAIDDEGLKEIFKDYEVTSAHVVYRRGGRSKGFGFVELVDEEEQKKALEGLKDVESEGRILVIKVALSDQHVQPSGSGGDDITIEKPEIWQESFVNSLVE
ncbi:15532_t:CDS:2 [Funneliformis geosporum]|uniref:15532_t:CDS:1 n=1 Tax=Funneliformis geosporum TaxID=1117311 RepID=A0A9W4SLQ1_9GLOM|nr:15532_t:CDS:2 [Funneliformis geosporum]